MEKIKNYDIYIKRMNVTISDKLFFLKEMDFGRGVEVFVDFGCGDGELITQLKELYPNKLYVGYDIDEKMGEIFKRKNPEATFISSLLDLAKFLHTRPKVAINFSSVLHEVYSYCPDAKDYWTFIYDYIRPNYIFIRDMGFEGTVDLDYLDKMAKTYKPELYADYRAHRKSELDILEFYLKFNYTNNWERERDELYFYDTKIFSVSQRYETIYDKKFNIPWQIKNIKENFGGLVDLSNVNTHYKKIYKAKGAE